MACIVSPFFFILVTPSWFSLILLRMWCFFTIRYAMFSFFDSVHPCIVSHSVFFVCFFVFSFHPFSLSIFFFFVFTSAFFSSLLSLSVFFCHPWSVVLSFLPFSLSLSVFLSVCMYLCFSLSFFVRHKIFLFPRLEISWMKLHLPVTLLSRNHCLVLMVWEVVFDRDVTSFFHWVISCSVWFWNSRQTKNHVKEFCSRDVPYCRFCLLVFPQKALIISLWVSKSDSFPVLYWSCMEVWVFSRVWSLDFSIGVFVFLPGIALFRYLCFFSGLYSGGKTLQFEIF